MDRPAAFFSVTYAQARRRFLAAAEALQLTCTSHPHPLRGREHELLAMDVVVDAVPRAQSVLIVSSGCHGVEGYAGSGLQLFALQDRQLRDQAREAGVTLVHIHALNPFGFSFLHRTTHENVDLNRNFPDFSVPLAANPGYAAVHPLLLPDRWPPSSANEAALMQAIEASGTRAFQAVVARGQHEHADGLFYAGLEPCWSHLTLRKVLREAGSDARRLAWIDVHTGLGPPGVGERILACERGAAESRARAWWGPVVTSTHDDSSSSTALEGTMWTAARTECPQAEFTGIALEFGTVPVLQVLQALRADNWLLANRRHVGTARLPEDLVRLIGRQMLDTFNIDTDEWKGKVLSQGREAISQAIAGLCANPQPISAPLRGSSAPDATQRHRDSSSH